MMEVIGAVASFIAIGQAIAVLPKIASTLKTFSNAEKDVASLAEELQRMHEFYEYTKTSIDLFSNETVPQPLSVPEPPHLLRLRTDLERFTQELTSLIRSCSKTDISDGRSKVSRLKWLRRKKDIVGLSTRCRDLRSHLERAITPLLLQVQRNHGTLLYELHAHVVKPTRHLALPQQSDQRRTITEEVDETPQTEVLPPSPSSGPPTKETHQMVPRQHDRHGISPWNPPREQCSCACHDTVTSLRQTVRWSFSRALLYSPHMTTEISRKAECRDCSCLQSRSRFKIDFCCPIWFWSGVVSGSVSFGGPIGMSASLRPIVIIRRNDFLWVLVSEDHHDRFQQLMKSSGFALTDTDVNNQPLLKILVVQRHFRILSHIPREWFKNMERTTAIMEAAWEAQALLHDPRKTPTKPAISLLQYIVDIADSDNSDEFTEPFRWINCPQKLDHLLQRNAGIARATGPTGETLLHVACRFNSVQAAEILISHGLDINAQDNKHLTPLHTALYEYALDCAHILIDHGCDCSLGDYKGTTPLDIAVMSASPEATNIVQRLLNGQTPEFNLSGDTPLHRLSVLDLKEDMVQDRLEMLLGAGCGSFMESWGILGSTPLQIAIWNGRARVVHPLIKAGARVDATDIYGRNILHAAGDNANLQVTLALHETKIDSIDIRMRNSRGHTVLYGIQRGIIWNLEYPEVFPRPRRKETRAFEMLLRDIRDRAIKTELNNLHDIITMINEGKTSKAQEAIGYLAQGKKRLGIECEAETFRIIGLQIRQSMCEPAIESLEEFMEVSQARVHISPFDELDFDHSLLKLYLKWVEDGLEGESTWTSYFSRFPKLVY